MTVELWWATTNITIATVLALAMLAMSIAVTIRAHRAARNGKILQPAAVVVALVVAMIAVHTYTADTGDPHDLQDVLDRRLSIHGPFAEQVWADAWSNIHTITACSVVLRYIYIGLGLLVVAAAFLTVVAASRWFANHPAAQHSENLVEAVRSVFLSTRPAPTVAEPTAAQQYPTTWGGLTQPRPALLAALAVAVVATITLLAVLGGDPEKTAAHHRIAEPPPPRAISTTGGVPLDASSKPPAEPDIVIPFVLTHEPCSIDVNCAIRTATDRITITLARPTTLTGVSLVPDELVPGRIVTKARWDFDDPEQTSETVQYDAVKDPGWSVSHVLSHPVRASKFALTILASTPVNPNVTPPGPAIAAALTAHARPPLPCDPDDLGALPADTHSCPTARMPR